MSPTATPSQASALRAIAPGLMATIVAAVVVLGIHAFVPALSALLLAIILGAVWANVSTIPAAFSAGITFSSKRLLRAGIVLLGLQLSLSSVLDLGWQVIVIVLAVVTLGVLGTLFIGVRLGLPWSQSALIACGFSICGAAAVAGADGVIRAKQEEAATAIALVVLFGTLMIPLAPLICTMLGLPEEAAGIFIGGSTHEVAQVVAAAGTMGPGVLAVAVVVKLARVLCLAPVMVGFGMAERRRARRVETSRDPELALVPGAEGAGGGVGQAHPDAAPKLPPIVPLFVVGFIAMVLARTTGFVPEPVLLAADGTQQFLLCAAMFGLGCGVRFRSLLRVGPLPFITAGAGTLVVAGTALVGIAITGAAA